MDKISRETLQLQKGGILPGVYRFPAHSIVAFDKTSGLLDDFIWAARSTSVWHPIAAMIWHSRNARKLLQEHMTVGLYCEHNRHPVGFALLFHSLPKPPPQLNIPKEENWEKGPWLYIPKSNMDDFAASWERSVTAAAMGNVEPEELLGRAKPRKAFKRQTGLYFMAPAPILDKVVRPIDTLFGIYPVEQLCVLHWRRAIVLARAENTELAVSD